MDGFNQTPFNAPYYSGMAMQCSVSVSPSIFLKQNFVKTLSTQIELTPFIYTIFSNSVNIDVSLSPNVTTKYAALPITTSVVLGATASVKQSLVKISLTNVQLIPVVCTNKLESLLVSVDVSASVNQKAYITVGKPVLITIASLAFNGTEFNSSSEGSYEYPLRVLTQPSIVVVQSLVKTSLTSVQLIPVVYVHKLESLSVFVDVNSYVNQKAYITVGKPVLITIASLAFNGTEFNSSSEGSYEYPLRVLTQPSIVVVQSLVKSFTTSVSLSPVVSSIQVVSLSTSVLMSPTVEVWFVGQVVRASVNVSASVSEKQSYFKTITTLLDLTPSVNTTFITDLHASVTLTLQVESKITQTHTVSSVVATLPSISTRWITYFDLYNVTSCSITKSVDDVSWSFLANCDEHVSPPAFSRFFIQMPSMGDSYKVAFVGVIPGSSYVTQFVNNKTELSGFDHSWYLTKQKIGTDNYYPDNWWSPASIVTFLIAGSVPLSMWDKVTGLYPYRIVNPPSGYEAKDWLWNFDNTKAEAIQEMQETYDMVFHVKPRMIDGSWVMCAYFVPAADVDHEIWGLDLADPYTVTTNDEYLKDVITEQKNLDEQINDVRIYAKTIEGATLVGKVQSAGVIAGTEKSIQYFEMMETGTAYEDLLVRAQSVYDFYNVDSTTYTATFVENIELELYQKIRFIGFDSLPTDWMRIVQITYVMESLTNRYVTVQFMKDRSMSDLRNLTKVMNSNPVTETEIIVDNKIRKLSQPEIGIITDIDEDENTATIDLNKGGTVTATRLTDNALVGHKVVVFTIDKGLVIQ